MSFTSLFIFIFLSLSLPLPPPLFISLFLSTPRSGHGAQMTNTTGDETDGMDEVLVPMDFMTEGAWSVRGA